MLMWLTVTFIAVSKVDFEGWLVHCVDAGGTGVGLRNVWGLPLISPFACGRMTLVSGEIGYVWPARVVLAYVPGTLFKAYYR